MSIKRNASGSIVVIILAIVLIVILASATLLMVKRSKDDKTTNQIANSADNQQVVNTEETSTTSEEVEVEPVTQIVEDVSIKLQTPEDISKLPDNTPASFKSYISAKLAAFDCDFNEFPDGSYAVTKISQEFINGGMGCGGGAAITWYYAEGGWQEFGYQSAVPCSSLVERKIPSNFIPDCYDLSDDSGQLKPNPNPAI